MPVFKRSFLLQCHHLCKAGFKSCCLLVFGQGLCTLQGGDAEEGDARGAHSGVSAPVSTR